MSMHLKKKINFKIKVSVVGVFCLCLYLWVFLCVCWGFFGRELCVYACVHTHVLTYNVIDNKLLKKSLYVLYLDKH